jgi:acyl carrier protein
MDDLRQEILAEIRRTLSAELEFPGQVELHHELAADLQVDSVGALVLAVALEDRFRVKLTGTEASSVVSVEDLVGVVERAVNADRPVGGANRSAGEQGGAGRPCP